MRASWNLRKLALAAPIFFALSASAAAFAALRAPAASLRAERRIESASSCQKVMSGSARVETARTSAKAATPETGDAGIHTLCLDGLNQRLDNMRKAQRQLHSNAGINSSLHIMTAVGSLPSRARSAP